MIMEVIGTLAGLSMFFGSLVLMPFLMVDIYRESENPITAFLGGVAGGILLGVPSIGILGWVMLYTVSKGDSK